jgi:uncharacterized protein YkwD
MCFYRGTEMSYNTISKMAKITTVFAFVTIAIFSAGAVHASTESDFLSILNQERARFGKAPMVYNTNLHTAAYLHSQDMNENSYFSHTSRDGSSFANRLSDAGYTGYYSASENIAYHYGAPNAEQIFAMWKNSAPHYANMLGSFNEAGLGVYYQNGRTHYTLDMGYRPVPTAAPVVAAPPPAPATVAPAPAPTPTPAPVPVSSCVRSNPTITVSTYTSGVYTVKVRNNDNSNCGASTFSVTPALPAGLVQSPSYVTINSLAPGSTISFRVRMSGTARGTFTETARNTQAPAYLASASASY